MQPVMARRILQWRTNQQPPPWELMVCPTHRCNLRCGICARSWEGTTAEPLLDELPEERWLRLVEEAADMGVRYLNIGGGGEPTLRRELVLRMCAKAKASGMEVHLQTNGTTLSQDDLDRLIALRLDYVTVSVDGPTAEINDAIRFKNAFEETVKRIEWLHTLKKRHRSSIPHLQVNMVVTALNYTVLDAMVDFCVGHGVEYLSAKTLLEYSPEMKAYILSAEQQAALPGEVEKALAKSRQAGLSNNLDSLLPASVARKDIGEPGKGDLVGKRPVPFTQLRCLEPWRGVVISSSGHAAPCCFFWDGTADSIRDHSLEAVWFGPYLTSFRHRLQCGDLPAPCKTCGFPDCSEHRQLAYCIAQAVESQDKKHAGPAALLGKAWNSLRRHGLRTSLRRYQEWRAIRRALRNESQ